MRRSASQKVLAGVRFSAGFAILCSSLACGRFASEPADSSAQEFQGPQLMGHGMEARTVSLTFDDGPGPRTAELSRFLKAEGVRGTFFVNISMQCPCTAWNQRSIKWALNYRVRRLHVG